jgi:crossover junction endodeoxyribonuclease RusA
MTKRLTFYVPGTPIAQGSKRHVGGGRMVESAKGLKDWRRAITDAAFTWRFQQPTITGPVSVELSFTVARPKSHHVAGDRDRQLKASAPWHPTVKPDIDKTARAVLDAITESGLWADDAQVVRLACEKGYGDPGVRITVETL